MGRFPKITTTPTQLQMARSMCWHCQSEVAGEYFCERCVKVQPLSKELDYFTCLGLPRQLNIAPEALESKFYELSRVFHPDFFQSKSPTEQSISLGNSALVNTAYRTLKDPIRRADYLLKLEAGSAKDIRVSPPADLFAEILEIQEDLEELRSIAPGKDHGKIEPLLAKLITEREGLESRQKGMEARLFELFTLWDRLQDSDMTDPSQQSQRESILREMREILSHRTYLCNILDGIVAALGSSQK